MRVRSGGAELLALAVLLLVSACSDPAPSAGVPAGTDPQASATGAAVLPDFCAGLLAPVEFADILDVQQAGGSTAEYAAPDPAAGLLAGMVCRRGVDAAGAKLTVSAHAYDRPAQARRYVRERVRRRIPAAGATEADRVRVDGRSAYLVESFSDSRAYVRDAGRAVEVTLLRGAQSAAQARAAVLRITAAVVRGLPPTSPR